MCIRDSINESAAKLWPAGEDPTGRHMQIDALAQPLQPPVLMAAGNNSDVMIVGVIGDTKNDGLGDATLPAVYLPYTIIAPPDRQLAVRTAGEPLAILNAVREKVRELDKDMALSLIHIWHQSGEPLRNFFDGWGIQLSRSETSPWPDDSALRYPSRR